MVIATQDWKENRKFKVRICNKLQSTCWGACVHIRSQLIAAMDTHSTSVQWHHRTKRIKCIRSNLPDHDQDQTKHRCPLTGGDLLGEVQNIIQNKIRRRGGSHALSLDSHKQSAKIADLYRYKIIINRLPFWNKAYWTDLWKTILVANLHRNHTSH